MLLSVFALLQIAYLDKARELNVHEQEARHDVKKCQQLTVGMNSSKPIIIVITPTVAKLEQKADLTRLSNTLRLVQDLHWIVIEDAAKKTQLVTNFLAECRVSYTHLNMKTPKSRRQKEARHRGVMQRNAGLAWIREQHINVGVVYFADDDNTYDIRLFEEMRYTKGVSIWPVGLVGRLLYEAPFVNQEGKVIGFRTLQRGRTFPTDMASFAISVKLLNDNPSVYFRMSAHAGFLEDDLLKQLGITLSDLEPKADGCTKVLVWHTRTQKSRLVYGDVMIRRHGHLFKESSIEV